MRTEDQVITQFNMRLIRAVMPQGAPMIVVYEDPKDYPGLFVARLFDGRKSTHLIALADTLEDIREAKPDADRKSDRTGQPANCGSLALTERSSEHEKKGSGNIKSSLDDCDQRCTDQRRPDVPEPAKAGRGAEQITKKRGGL